MTEGSHEIACPNCAATYQVPAGAIGAKGRRLVCSVCETAWRAMPGDLRASIPVAPVVTAPPSAPAPAMAGGAATVREWDAPPAPSRADWRADPPAPQPPAPLRPTDSAQAAPPPEPAPTAPQPAAPSAERLAQMAEIRQMLAELKSPGQTGVAEAAPHRARTAPPPEPAPRPGPERTVVQPAPPAPEPAPEPEPEYADDVDPLRARLAQHGVMAKAYRADPVKNPYDRAKLIRKHDRKIRRRRLQDSTGAGAFVSGFLLIVMVSAGMTAIYILHPQLIARFPTMEKPLLDYVATIDGLRVSLAQTTNDAIEWVRARLLRN